MLLFFAVLEMHEGSRIQKNAIPHGTALREARSGISPELLQGLDGQGSIGLKLRDVALHAHWSVYPIAATTVSSEKDNSIHHSRA